MSEFEYMKYLENLLKLINQIVKDAGFERIFTMEELYIFLGALTIFLLASFIFLFVIIFRKEKGEVKAQVQDVAKKATPEELLQEKPKETPVETPLAPVQEVTWKERLEKGLTSSRQGVWGKLTKLVGPKGLDEDTMDEIEELLYSADIGGDIVSELIDKMNQAFQKGEVTSSEFTEFLKDFIKSKMKDIQANVDPALYTFDKDAAKMTKVVMVVGVNGAGKTTTIGKLATKLTAEGAKVVVGACDTFRAAAVDQLAVWCERAGATMVRAREGANPSGVGYDTLQKAINENADYCILDTAGRLHTKTNLMDELGKSKNVLAKLDQSAPHQVLLVIDAITGQNALRQAEEFNKALGLTGLIFTKCDGSSKAGSAIGIVDKLKVPITYIGVGEDVNDLNVFDLDEYLNALLDY